MPDYPCGLRDLPPGRVISCVLGYVEAIDYGGAAGIFALEFDVYQVPGFVDRNRGIEGDRHRHRVGEGDSVLAGLDAVAFLRRG